MPVKVFPRRILFWCLGSNQVPRIPAHQVNIRQNQSEIMLRLSFQRPSSVFRDRVQTSSARALPIIMRICRKGDIIMGIHQYTLLLLRVRIIIPVLLIKNSVKMRIHKYALVRIHINALLRICVNASQTVQSHHPDRICILVHCAQPICIIFMNTHYNGFFYEHSEN